MAKLAICPTCRREAVGIANEQFPAGVPVVLGNRFTSGHFPVVVNCDRCKRSFKIDALAFNAMPQMTNTQIADLRLESVLGTTPSR